MRLLLIAVLTLTALLPGLRHEARAQAECVSIAHTQYDGTKLTNSCDRKISIHWIDVKYCRTGCAAVVSPGGTSKVLRWQGNVRYAVCWDNTAPRGFKEDPTGTYECP